MSKDSNSNNWRLVAKEDLEEISSYLLSLVTDGENVTNETELGRIIHTLDSGINSTNSVPSDFEEIRLLKHFNEFVGELRQRLIEDNDRWGDTYLNRSKNGQEMRVKNILADYFDKFEYAEKPIEWLAVIGNAYIAWLRENHQEMSGYWDDNVTTVSIDSNKGSAYIANEGTEYNTTKYGEFINDWSDYINKNNKIPDWIVVAVKLPTGTIEVITNSYLVEDKYKYYLDAYDENLRLETNENVKIVSWMFA